MKNLIQSSISSFSLDLSGLTVLTEAATGYYLYTPIIAAMSGANRVLALTRDSSFGRSEEVYSQTIEIADQWNLSNKIEVLRDRNDFRIPSADIVTNLGFVRPIDAAFLNKLKKTAVIPLMWETWEYRPQDLELEGCRRLGIPVLGTNEHHPALRTFEYIGLLAIKLLLSLDIELFRSRIVILGSGEFGDIVHRALRSVGAIALLVCTEKRGVLTTSSAKSALRGADAIVVVEHTRRDELIGPEGEITIEELSVLNPRLSLAHICGGVNQKELKAAGYPHQPATFASPGFMSVATDFLGPKPVIDLHTAGLKIGQLLATTVLKGLSGLKAELSVLRNSSLAQGFSGYHDDYE